MRRTGLDATALAFAAVGSGEQAGKPGDWGETVRLLVEAGASREGVWITGKPPSEEVVERLRHYGIGPDDQCEEDADEPLEMPTEIGTGVMADIARHLEAAYRELDIEVLGSLLHPEVQWAGVCHDSAEVLDWYRKALADGTRPAVQSVEVDRDAVVLGLCLARQAEGARPAPPQQLYQFFTVENAQIVEIRGYPDRAKALARAW